jgi:hypothetical protein
MPGWQFLPFNCSDEQTSMWGEIWFGASFLKIKVRVNNIFLSFQPFTYVME